MRFVVGVRASGLSRFEALGFRVLQFGVCWFRVRGSGFGVFHVRGFAVMGFEVSGVGFGV